MNRRVKVIIGVVGFFLVAGLLWRCSGGKTQSSGSAEKAPAGSPAVKPEAQWKTGDMSPYVQGRNVMKKSGSSIKDYSESVTVQRDRAILRAVETRKGKKVSLPPGFDVYEARILTEQLLYSDAACNGDEPLSDAEKKALIEAGNVVM
jgi:hypothetical protein